MSEAASASPTAGATTTAAPSSAGQPAGGASQGKGPGGQGGAPQAQGAADQGQAPQVAQDRVLAEQDLDAYIEHTINGRKEKIKVRDALKGYGLDKTANQRMQEAAEIRRREQQNTHLMQTDFGKWCEVNGVDRDQFLRANLSQRKEIAEEILAREYELQQMDPHQRKALDLEQQVKQFQQREMAVKKPLIDAIKDIVPAERLPRGLENATEGELRGFLAERQNEFNAGLDTLSNELLEAWQKVGLPKQKDFGQWMAQVMIDHDKRSTEHRKRTGEEIPPLLPEQAAVKVKQRFLDSTRTLFSEMDAPAIQEALGEAIIKKLRDHDVGMASSQNRPMFSDPNRPPTHSGASEPKRQLNQMEWRKEMGLA